MKTSQTKASQTKTSKTLLTLVIFATSLSATPTRANLILNGDFELNNATETEFNLTNSEFNNFVPSTTAFGNNEEIDLVTSDDFHIVPQSGNWKLGLNTLSGAVDAFSLDLSVPVVAGTTYNLQFFGARLIGRASGIEVGLSNSATSFGTLFFSGTPSSTSTWTQFDYQFVATASASFLTVRNISLPNLTYNFVDNFSLTLSGDFEPDEDVDGTDFLTWQRNLGTSGPAGDANHDGVVDGSDLAAWEQNYGSGGVGTIARSTTVPEPSTLLLVAFGLATGAAVQAKGRAKGPYVCLAQANGLGGGCKRKS